jgi:hypothetical protein
VQINKIIRQLHDQGLLDVGYDWIELRDPEKLRAMAGLSHSVLGISRPTACLDTLGLTEPRDGIMVTDVVAPNRGPQRHEMVR